MLSVMLSMDGREPFIVEIAETKMVGHLKNRVPNVTPADLVTLLWAPPGQEREPLDPFRKLSEIPGFVTFFKNEVEQLDTVGRLAASVLVQTGSHSSMFRLLLCCCCAVFVDNKC